MSDIVLKELLHRLKPTAKSGSWFCFSDFSVCLPGILELLYAVQCIM